MVLAAWFHDSVYDGQPEAERRSAAWAAEALPTLVDDDVVEEVVRLVLLTEHHRPSDNTASDAQGPGLALSAPGTQPCQQCEPVPSASSLTRNSAAPP